MLNASSCLMVIGVGGGFVPVSPLSPSPPELDMLEYSITPVSTVKHFPHGHPTGLHSLSAYRFTAIQRRDS